MGFNLVKIGAGIVARACGTEAVTWKVLGWDAVALIFAAVMLNLRKKWTPAVILTATVILTVVNYVYPISSMYLPSYPPHGPMWNVPNLEFKEVHFPSVLMTGVMLFIRYTISPDIYKKSIHNRTTHTNPARRYQWLGVVQAGLGGPTVIENGSIYDLQLSMGVKGRAPQVIACGMLLAVWCFNFEPVRYVPASVLAGILGGLGGGFLRRWAWMPELGTEKVSAERSPTNNKEERWECATVLDGYRFLTS